MFFAKVIPAGTAAAGSGDPRGVSACYLGRATR